ncbi:MAG TPA: c-type cytochrome [Steroidobacteraceae bacterium]
MKLLPPVFFSPAVVFFLMSAAGAAFADEPVGFQEGMRLLAKYHCQTCHAVDRTLAGPSLHDVAKKYASDPHARSVLGESILNGSTGVWGGAVPMPPTKVPAADLKPLVEWILSLDQY